MNGVSEMFPWGDEFHSLRHWGASVPDILATYDDRGSGIALPLLQRAFHDVLGPTILAARLPALLGGLAVLALAYPVARRLVGARAAAVAMLWIALSPPLVFYSHFARAYALAGALALLLVLALDEASAAEERRAGWLALACIATALLPWVHATAAVMPPIVGGAALLRAGANRRRARALEIAACLALGALLCLLLYLPAWSSAIDFLTRTSGSSAGQRVSIVSVLSVLGGSRTLAWVLLLGVPTAAVALVWARRSAALLPLAAVFSSVVALWLVSPRGGPYAYARYLLASLPFALMLVSWLLCDAIERAFSRRPRFAAPAAVTIGALAIGVATFAAHSSPAAPSEGAFAGTYLSLWPLARFDVVWDRAPGFYRGLGDDDEISRILEVPMPRSRAALLYRNYFLTHGKETWLGEVGRSVVEHPRIVSLDRAETACTSGADVAILHVALERELAGWWEQVYPEAWSYRLPRTFISLARPFEGTPLWFRRDEVAPLADDFVRVFGRPIHEDGLIRVFRLDPAICGRGAAVSRPAAEARTR